MKPMPRVLLVDDDKDFLDSLRHFLEEAGHEVTAALGASRALEVLAQGQSHDVAVIDVYMPEMDGRQLAERMRTELGARKIPVILLSGKTFELRPSLGMTALSKAGLRGTLLQEIERVCRDARAQDQVEPELPGP